MLWLFRKFYWALGLGMMFLGLVFLPADFRESQNALKAWERVFTVSNREILLAGLCILALIRLAYMDFRRSLNDPDWPDMRVRLAHLLGILFRSDQRQAALKQYTTAKNVARLGLAETRLKEMRSHGLDAAAQLVASEQISRCEAFWQKVPTVPDPPNIVAREAARSQPQGVDYFDFRTVKHAFRAIDGHVSRINQQILALTGSVRGYDALDKRYSQLRIKWEPSQQLLESEPQFYFPDDAARRLWLDAHRATDAFAKVRYELEQELLNIERQTREIPILEQYLPRLPLDTE